MTARPTKNAKTTKRTMAVSLHVTRFGHEWQKRHTTLISCQDAATLLE